ncbi:MAG: tRNA lysidine(34) synthetase TilS [bacterium]|nr:tRNA lysidine(34) synthetase TilS [bacterium]
MKVNIPSGRYVIAVSGGVDSMVLLDILAKLAKSRELRAESKKTLSSQPTAHSSTSLRLVVAHFNHGIRPDSPKDEKLVTKAAQGYKLAFEIGQGKLGAGASEEQARKARYQFLESVAKKHKARGIITAHHQDDLIETALINILRGTGRAGLSSMAKSKIYRPLLGVPKTEILAYARKNKIQWREDSTNDDIRYLRNYIRAHIMSRLTSEKKAEMVNNLDKVAKINKIIDEEIATLSHIHQKNRLNRQAYIMLPTQVGEELLMNFLRHNRLGHFDKKTIKRLSTVIKTGQPGSVHDVMEGRRLKLTTRLADLI